MSDLKQFQFTEATEEEDETYAKAEFLEVISLLIFSGPAQGEGLCRGEGGGAGVSQKRESLQILDLPGWYLCTMCTGKLTRSIYLLFFQALVEQLDISVKEKGNVLKVTLY